MSHFSDVMSLEHFPSSQLGYDDFRRYLTQKGKVADVALERVGRIAGESGDSQAVVLTRLGLLSEQDLALELSLFCRLPRASEKDIPNEPLLEDTLNPQFLKQNWIIPLREAADGLIAAVADPLDPYVAEALRFATGKQVQLWVATQSEIASAYERLYGDGQSEMSRIIADTDARPDGGETEEIEALKDMASEAPVIRLVNMLIARAVEARASDIHIEPMAEELRVRYRIDGVLHEVESPPSRLRAAVTSRIKVMAKLNIAERRLAQDGRIRFAVQGRDIDFRVSTTPTIHGESVVMRILDRSSLKLDFASLGFDGDVLPVFRKVLEQPHGIVLVTGPTGSGKTTTLYAALLEINTVDKKVLTIEDPVEYQLNGVNQVQIKPQIGLTFANALRSFLRQDPDIMMIGEIRDLETAQIAVQAALTGHLILSTLHTNDAASAITRLLDMGVENYLLTSTVNGLVAQRLVRTLCPHCRHPYTASPELLDRSHLDGLADDAPITLYRPVGCPRCNGTGYFGRSSILEVMPMSDGIRHLILRNSEASLIHRTAVDEGMQSMYIHGMKKALSGITSIEEVFRVTREI